MKHLPRWHVGLHIVIPIVAFLHEVAAFDVRTAQKFLTPTSPNTTVVAGDPRDAPHRSAGTSASLLHSTKKRGLYNEETPLVLLGRVLPITAESIFAAIFVCMIASVPMAIAYLEQKPSKTHLCQSAALLAWLVGCLYLFTQVVEFRSVHFAGQRPLTLVETIYLMAQVLTTVGHGDITPASEGGEVVVGIYVFFTIVLIADMVSAVVYLAIANTKEYTKQLGIYSGDQLLRTASHGGQATTSASGQRAGREHEHWLQRKAPPLPWAKLLSTLAGFFFFVIMGTLFYHFYPGEGKTWLEGLYMSIITLSTVGFGAVLPTTEAGKVFGAFWMLFGVISLLSLVGGFTELILAMKAREQWNDEEEHAELNWLRARASQSTDGQTLVVNKYDFLQFGIVHSRMLSREDVEKIEQTFEAFGPDGSGNVSFEAIERAARVNCLQ